VDEEDKKLKESLNQSDSQQEGEKFNISVAKVKRFFNIEYIFQFLTNESDIFIQENAPSKDPYSLKNSNQNTERAATSKSKTQIQS
jgi:hypothetical protein